MADAEIYTTAKSFRSALLKRERAAAVRLVKAYGSAYERISAQLKKVTDQIQEARAAGEPVSEAWLFRQERYAALLGQVVREIGKFADVVGSVITAQQREAVNQALEDSQQLLLTAVEQSPQIGASFNQVPKRAVENLVGFLGDGSPLKSLLDKLPRNAAAIVSRGLTDGVVRGRNPKVIAREIRAGLNGSLTRALRIARTETLRSYREASHQTYRENSDVVEGWVWTSALGSRSCAACVSLHGTFHELDERMASHVQCRCSQIPQVKGADLRIERGADWFAKQKASVQKEILDSPGAYEAYKSGKIKLEDFVGLKRSAQWGDSYQALTTKRALAGEGRFPGDAARRRDIIPPISQPPRRLALTPDQIELIRNGPSYRDEGGSFDSAKVGIGLLGLTHGNPFPPGLVNRAKRLDVDINQISLGRPALDRERLLRSAESLKDGIKTKGKGIEPIELSQKPDGSFVVGGDGNHRVAALKLMGYQGTVSARVRLQKVARLPAQTQLGPGAIGTPVADGLKLPSRGDLARIGRAALDAVGQVHGDGDLPQIPVRRERSRKRLGGYWYRTSRPPTPLKITLNTTEHPELTLAHEIGHFLDQQGAGEGKDHASPRDPRFEEFRRAVEQSAAIRELKRLLQAGRVRVTLAGATVDYPVDVRNLRYLLQMKEVWARAYAQYIAIRSGDKAMLGQLNELRERIGEVYHPEQWDDGDFAPIAEALDRLMISLGWRQ